MHELVYSVTAAELRIETLAVLAIASCPKIICLWLAMKCVIIQSSPLEIDCPNFTRGRRAIYLKEDVSAIEKFMRIFETFVVQTGEARIFIEFQR
jgi:hypothetical protein